MICKPMLLLFGLSLVPLAATSAIAQPPGEEPQLQGNPPLVTPEAEARLLKIMLRRPSLDRGFEQLGQEKWKDAAASFQQVLDSVPDDQQAHYGIARCYEAQDDTAKALEHYRLAVYNNPKQQQFSSLQEDRIARYALLLSRTGQADEAVRVYNYVVSRLNYRDGQPYLKVLLPWFGLESGQRSYRPDFFQAMAHTAAGLWSNERKPMLAHLREAVRLAPNSGLTHFYLAEMITRTGSNYAEARDEYLKARSLDPKMVGKAAEKELGTSTMQSVMP